MAAFQLMGVINVTPDSFSDGGAFIEPDAAVTHGKRLVAEGADILDIGGESTRPGADPVSEGEEMWRVLPPLECRQDVGAELSIDTRKPAGAKAALETGATVVHDVSTVRFAPDTAG